MAGGPVTSETLPGLRCEIDDLDAQIVRLLAARLQVVERVVQVKQRDGLPANIPERVEEVVAAARHRAEAEGVPPDLAELLWRDLVSWTIAYEDRHLAIEGNDGL
ncbi:chorismate mutase [Labrys monachus]|uniref:chorismate mutase n=1 Tax=Labrys monachus TaxID=217067 RepID=A0ABU0FEJ9_9HYPH|nr:chorismate mutase [Labrys monachus]MDQ0393043.1 isochorismate pyruvate lyase [Labrys monachus]